MSEQKIWQSEVSKLILCARFVIIYAAALKDVQKEYSNKVKSLFVSMPVSPSHKQNGLKETIENLYELHQKPKEITNGLVWEVKEAVMQNSPEKLILAIPTDIESYDKFKKATASLFPKELPDVSFNRNFKSKFIEERNIRGFIYFDFSWTPSLVQLRTPKYFEILLI